jgi:hypothetical protein
LSDDRNPKKYGSIAKEPPLSFKGVWQLLSRPRGVKKRKKYCLSVNIELPLSSIYTPLT